MAEPNILYFVYYDEGTPTRVAKIEDLSVAYGWENGKWEEMPSLMKIVNDITDYEEITKAEAEKIIAENF